MKNKPEYVLTFYSQIDHSIQGEYRFKTEIEARVAKVKMEGRYREDLCFGEIEVVYER